jgi:hypothetical protein
LPIGISDFKELRENHFYFVDKTHFIREMIEAAAKVVLLPRPRRFGKTLNLSMLRYFFESGRPQNRDLFRGLAIERDACFQTHQGRYPVLFMTFKDIKEPSWEMCRIKLFHTIGKICRDHQDAFARDGAGDPALRWFQRITTGEAHQAEYEDCLRYVSESLHERTGNPIVILIDEYDTPLHAGYEKGYYEEITGFMRNLLSGGFKDNPHLYKGVLTGVLRVAKESIFSGLNNLGVYSILVEEFSDAFGFTDEEVHGLLSDYGISERYDETARWYDGYRFGGKVIYNPWSLVNYVNSKSKTPAPYWLNTGDTAFIDRLATRGGKEIREEIGRLLEGGVIERPVYETIVLRDLDLRDDLLWSLLLFCGYLKPMGGPVFRNIYPLSIPNREVRLAYEEMVIRWFSEKIESNCLLDMLQALSGGDMDLFERLLRKIVEQVMSYHDFSGEPEKVYHALVLGMLIWMSGKYDIRSNRESGYGRYDILLKPKDRGGTGIIMEFKLVDKPDENAHEQVLTNALKQIEDRGYQTELTAGGVTDILKIAVAFRGKSLWVKHAR